MKREISRKTKGLLSVILILCMLAAAAGCGAAGVSTGAGKTAAQETEKNRGNQITTDEFREWFGPMLPAGTEETDIEWITQKIFIPVTDVKKEAGDVTLTLDGILRDERTTVLAFQVEGTERIGPGTGNLPVGSSWSHMLYTESAQHQPDIYAFKTDSGQLRLLVSCVTTMDSILLHIEDFGDLKGPFDFTIETDLSAYRTTVFSGEMPFKTEDGREFTLMNVQIWPMSGVKAIIRSEESFGDAVYMDEYLSLQAIRFRGGEVTSGSRGWSGTNGMEMGDEVTGYEIESQMSNYHRFVLNPEHVEAIRLVNTWVELSTMGECSEIQFVPDNWKDVYGDDETADGPAKE